MFHTALVVTNLSVEADIKQNEEYIFRLVFHYHS